MMKLRLTSTQSPAAIAVELGVVVVISLLIFTLVL